LNVAAEDIGNHICILLGGQQTHARRRAGIGGAQTLGGRLDGSAVIS
jgi:hypothetical protein